MFILFFFNIFLFLIDLFFFPPSNIAAAPAAQIPHPPFLYFLVFPPSNIAAAPAAQIPHPPFFYIF